MSVSRLETRFIQAHVLFTGIHLLKHLSAGFLPCAGLRLGVLRQFQAFLASSPCAASATSYHFASIAPPPWRRAFSQFAPVVKLGFPVLASGSNCAVKPTCLRQASYFRSLVPSYSASCRPPLTPALCLSPRFLLGGFGALRGFACVRFGRFKPFWPLAPVYPAPPAIFLAALRRFRGPALLRGLCPSSSQGAPFWPSGLTLRSSGLAFSQPLILAVSPITRSMRAATYFSAPLCSKGFQAFWAASACQPSATSYHFSSTASPRWRTVFSWFAPIVNLGFPVLASGSNRAVKPTRLRRSA